MKLFKGRVEIRDDGGRRVIFPVEVQACNWRTACYRAVDKAEQAYRNNRKGRRCSIKNIIPDITVISELGGVQEEKEPEMIDKEETES